MVGSNLVEGFDESSGITRDKVMNMEEMNGEINDDGLVGDFRRMNFLDGKILHGFGAHGVDFE
ncbi:hypothetical protein CUMW_257270 [Citrus unshiu]|uniref:Uncharacterized protein n=1 Tax=Citrus unshiu TaxID=55188 RepID=A0A2H5QSE0_CITUN|nr:hypothetical protein CUMW_257270 [Citrus unshiu]